MKFFLHTASSIRIITDAAEFECSPARFQELEPDYPGLSGAIARYWTPGRAYLEGVAEYDGHDCGQYCDRIAQYTQYPQVFAEVTLSKTTLNAGDPFDSIQFSAALKDAGGNTLPVSYNWFVRITHEQEGDIDRILLNFEQGQCAKTYTFLQGNPLGEWFVDESKFDVITVNGVLYQVKLTQPVRFVVYRELS